MFENSLYKIINLDFGTEQFNKISAKIELNEHHDIFKGHFPGNPVMPGVCFVQIIKDILSKCIGENIVLKSASNIKFLEIVNPVLNKNLDIEITLKNFRSKIESSININSIITNNEKTVFKMSAEFIVENEIELN